MSTLKVANVHFDSAGTNRINYLDDNTIRFHTNGAERLTLAPSGNLTIGRTDSTIGQGVLLDVNGSVNASSVLLNGAAAATTGKAIAMVIVFG